MQLARAADGSFVAVWLSFTDDVYARLFQADGTPRGPAFSVDASGAAYEARVGMDADGNFVIGWRTITDNASGDDVLFQRFNAQGTPLAEPQSALVLDGLVDIQTAEPGALVQAVLQEGPSELALSMNGSGDFVLGWIRHTQVGLCCAGLTGLSVSPYSVFYARPYSADGTPRRQPIQVSAGHSRSHPALAMDASGQFVAAWRHINLALSSSTIQLRHYDANGNAMSSATSIANTELATPSLAMNAHGDYTLLWTRGGDSNREIMSQRFTPDGNPSGQPQNIIENASALGRFIEAPAIAMAFDGSYSVAWAETQFTDDDTYNYNVFSHCYYENGDASSAEPVTVNQHPLSDREPQQLPANPALTTLAYDASGKLMVSWHRQLQQTSEIRARLISGCS